MSSEDGIPSSNYYSYKANIENELLKDSTGCDNFMSINRFKSN